MGIERSSSQDDLREHSGGSNGAIKPGTLAVPRNTVQRFRPPLVGGDVEPRNGCSGIDELRHLLVKSEAGNEVRSSDTGRQFGVAELE